MLDHRFFSFGLVKLVVCSKRFLALLPLFRRSLADLIGLQDEFGLRQRLSFAGSIPRSSTTASDGSRQGHNDKAQS
jgi:hypothetical protein